MESQFYCKSCNKIFDAEGIRKEYTDPIFGACMKYVAECPDCKTECKEYRKPVQKASKKSVCLPSAST